MTRVIPRKRIELTIQLIHEMQKMLKSPEIQKRIENKEKNGEKCKINNGFITKDSQFVLLLCREEDLTDNGGYFDALKAYADSMGVKLIAAGNRIAQKRGDTTDGKKIYSLLDSYFVINGMDYPSEQEGFGNQFLESVWGRHITPILQYPVFRADIKKYVRHFINQGTPDLLRPLAEYSFDDGEFLQTLPNETAHSTAQMWLNILMNPDLYMKYAEENLKGIRDRFDIQKVGEDFLSILNEMQQHMILSKLEQYA